MNPSKNLKQPRSPSELKRGSVLGKYRIEKLIGQGAFARVYAAVDSIEGIKVALKVPYEHSQYEEAMEQYRLEIRLMAKLDHPHVLPLKNADLINGHLIVASPLGRETLDSRLKRRISIAKSFAYFEQMILAVAYAHEMGVVHCDIKPENFILFGDIVKLADFGIAKKAKPILSGNGTGTVGHMSIEQAMGQPSKRGDVFSLGLIMYRMLTGNWPIYPFAWPPPGAVKLRTKRIHPGMIEILKKAIDVNPRRRFSDAISLQQEFRKALPISLRHLKKGKN